MYLKRKIDRYLEEWRKKEYESVIEINFIEEPKYKTILSDGYQAASVIRNISLIDPGKRFVEGETLLFLMKSRISRKSPLPSSFLRSMGDTM